MTTIRYRTCSICEANCGIAFELDGRRVVRTSGDPENLLSRGHICPKGTALADIQDDPDRLRRPMRRTGESWEEIDWDTAFAEIGARMAAVVADGGARSIYFGNPSAHNYTILPQVAALMAVLGAQAPFSASTIDHMPTMLVQYWMFGHQMLFPVVDLDRVKTVLMIGANPMVSNGSLMVAPGFQKRMAELHARGGRLILVDPRRTETARVADLHLHVRPGTDAAFLMAVLLVLDRDGGIAPGRLAPMLRGWDEAMAALRTFDLDALSATCGVPLAAIEHVAAALTDGPSAVYGRVGTSMQTFGTLCAWLIQLLNIATGNLDREGGLLFGDPAIDVVGQSPAGSFDTFRSRVSGLPEVMGELPVAVLAEEIATPGPGQIRALFTLAGNPVLSTPNGAALDAALETLELMVSVDLYMTETSRHAHYILPPGGPLENEHIAWYLAPMMVRNFVCYAPAVLDQEPGALGDWQILQRLATVVADATGLPLPPLVPPRETLDQALRASPRGLSLAELEAHPHGIDLGPLEPSLPGRLYTPDKLIDCAPAGCLADLDRLRATIAARDGENDGSILLIGRRQVRSNNSWLHNSNRLAKGKSRCTLMLHPEDAAARGIGDGDLVEVASTAGRVQVPAQLTDDLMPGVASLPHGFGHLRSGVRERVARALQPGVSFNDLTPSDAIDVPSGTAAVNGVPVTITLAAA